MSKMTEFIKETLPKEFARRTLAIMLVGTFCFISAAGVFTEVNLNLLKELSGPVGTVLALYFMMRKSENDNDNGE